YWSRKSWWEATRLRCAIRSRFHNPGQGQTDPRFRLPASPYQRRAQVIFCVRGVVRPMLANVYRLLKGWRNTKRGAQFRARVVNYADDFVILSSGKAKEALNCTRKVVTRLGLTLNEAKTSIQQARTESFDLLGYTFGPQRHKKDGRWYLGASPSKK